MAIWTLHTYRTHFTFAREKGVVWSGLEASWDRSKSFLTSQQKPDSPTKQKWAPPLLFSSLLFSSLLFLSNHIYNNFAADLLLLSSLGILQAMCLTITSLQVPTRVQMRTKNAKGKSAARPTLLKAHQIVADHILPLTFTIYIIICERKTTKLLPSLMEKN